MMLQYGVEQNCIKFVSCDMATGINLCNQNVVVISVFYAILMTLSSTAFVYMVNSYKPETYDYPIYCCSEQFFNITWKLVGSKIN